MDIRIQTLGRFAVWLDDRELTQILEQPIRAALLVYLAVEGEVTRDAAESVIWSDLPPGKARHALNQTLYRLRKDLGEDWLLAQGDLLTVTGGVRVDAREFETAVKAGAWAEGLEFYRGTFLDGWHLLGTSPFEHWTDRHCLRLSRLHREACRVGLSELKAAGRYADGLKLARAWVQRDPMEDEAQHSLIELLARTGQRGEALEQYEMYARLLAEDDLAPLAETRELVEGLRNGSALAGSPEAPSHPVAPSHLESPAGSGSWKPRRLRRTLFLASTLGLLSLSALLFVLSRRSAPELGLVANRVLVVPLDNLTGNPSLDPVGRMAADWVTQGLAGAEFLQTVQSGEVLPGFASGGGEEPSEDYLTRAIVAAEENGAGTLVTGTYYASGPGIEFHVQIMELPQRTVLESVGPVRTPSLDPMEALDVLRQRVMVSLAVHRNQSLGGILTESALPPSYPAYLAYYEGLRKCAAGDWRGSLPDFLRAYDLSPEFTSALIFAGFAFTSGWGNFAAADSVARIVEASSETLPTYDRLRLEFLRSTIQGDNAAGYRATKAAAAISPGGTAHFAAGDQALRLNRPREALELLSSWDPTREAARQWIPYWNVVTQAYHLLGEHDMELKEAQRGRRQIPDQLWTLAYEIRALIALGRAREVNDRLGESLHFRWTPDVNPGRVMLIAVQELLAHGSPESADSVVAKALVWYEALGEADRVREDIRSGRAQALYLDGQFDAARKEYQDLLSRDADNPEYLKYLGAIAALSGDRALALEYSEILAALDRPYLFGEHTLGRAVIAALLGDRETGLLLLQTSVAQGVDFGTSLHAEPGLHVLRGYRPFDEFLEPQG